MVLAAEVEGSQLTGLRAAGDESASDILSSAAAAAALRSASISFFLRRFRSFSRRLSRTP